MNKREYIEEITNCCIDFIDENFDYFDDFDDLFDEMQMQVTGNDNGSYYCNTIKAKEALEGVLFDESITELVRELGYENLPLDRGPEACDVIVRFVLLNYCVDRDELEEHYDEMRAEI